jgi:hypothetical protein
MVQRPRKASDCCLRCGQLRASDSDIRRYGISGSRQSWPYEGDRTRISHHCRFPIRDQTAVCGWAAYQICSFYPRPACQYLPRQRASLQIRRRRPPRFFIFPPGIHRENDTAFDIAAIPADLDNPNDVIANDRRLYGRNRRAGAALRCASERRDRPTCRVQFRYLRNCSTDRSSGPYPTSRVAGRPGAKEL